MITDQTCSKTVYKQPTIVELNLITGYSFCLLVCYILSLLGHISNCTVLETKIATQMQNIDAIVMMLHDSTTASNSIR